MKKQELVEASIHAVSEYYNGNLQPFFDVVSDRILWIGPRAGQVIQGRNAIIETWTAAESDLRFTMGNIEAKTASTGANNLEVLLEYHVYTHFPNGEIDRHHQRIHYSWGLRVRDSDGQSAPKVCMIHISNVTDGEEADMGNGDGGVKVYASSRSESRADAIDTPSLSRIHFRTVYGKGTNEATYYFNSGTILWIESANRSLHTIVHTIEGSYESTERLRSFEERYPDVFLRAHSSYLVNPLYVRSVKRFEATMTDGAKIPIPQKKYTEFKRRLEDWNWTSVG